MYNGIINVYKEKGFTSHDVVAKLRGILHQKKIGHTGTLDPDAQGVLPVCLGSGTKLCDMLTDTDKTYEAVLLLGLETDTQDAGGRILAQKSVAVTEEQAVTAIHSFIGEYGQIPPMYSAIKLGGKKLYELAREGKVVERAPRQVQIYSIEILEISLPRISIRVDCSKGTYIRTLCHDIGQSLGCGGCMESLVRTKVGSFSIEEAKKLSQIEQMVASGNFESMVTGVETVFEDMWAVHVASHWDRLLFNGNPFGPHCIRERIACVDKMTVRVYSEEDIFIGIYEFQGAKQLFYPVKIFYNNQE